MQYRASALVIEETREGEIEVQGTNKRKRRKEVIVNIGMRGTASHHVISKGICNYENSNS